MLNKIKVKDKFENFKQGFRLYPSSILFSMLLAVSLMYTSTISFTQSNEIFIENLRKIQMLLSILIFVFLTISNINLVSKNRYKLITNILGIISGILIYFFIINKQGTRYEISFIGIFLAFLVSSVSIVKDKDNFPFHIIKVIEDIIITFVYIGVIILGSFIIIFTTEFLFEFTFKYYIKQWILIISLFIFGIPFFISNLPDNLKEYKGYEVNRLIRALVEYVILFLIISYTLILYIYLGKVFITRIWPKGLVSHLVLWYLVFSLIILVLINDSKEKISLNFKKYFPKVSIPLVIMSFIAVGIRIDQYSFTENRYFVIAVGVFTLFSMLVYIFKKEKDLRIFSILFILTVFVSLFSPINAFRISQISQNNRLEKILLSNNMLEDNKLIKNEDISKKDAFEISNIIYYFKNNHNLSDLKYFKDINFDNFKDDYGFDYTPDRWYLEDLNMNENFNLNVFRESDYIDISKYDNFFKINSNKLEEVVNNDIKISLDSENTLKIYSRDNLIFEESIEKISFNILKENIGKNSNDIELEKAIYKFEDEKISLLLIPDGISGEKIKKDGEFKSVNINYLDFIILFTIK